ncbi:MAG: zinc ribbon domain-containing protein [Heliobacteriaceae bacterium]|nr:zinc ribbon domain-containing protein [Heliobacteriaceae bacterium]
MGGKKIEFVTNYSDLSTDKGFQFEFYCNRCGNGYRTPFKASVVGTVAGVLDTAGSVFGGFFSRAADVGERVRSAAWEKAHDEAFEAASTELRADFVQCPRCSSWVCRKHCWNDRKGLCKGCAPDLGVEMAAAQASRSVEEVWAHAAMAEEDKQLSEDKWRDNIRATCPECQSPLAANVKFCPDCGAKVKVKLNCKGCGTKLTPGSKFCPECGDKV